jgi:hypothetical protein
VSLAVMGRVHEGDWCRVGREVNEDLRSPAYR